MICEKLVQGCWIRLNRSSFDLEGCCITEGDNLISSKSRQQRHGKPDVVNRYTRDQSRFLVCVGRRAASLAAPRFVPSRLSGPRKPYLERRVLTALLDNRSLFLVCWADRAHDLCPHALDLDVD
ncbi:hypothetical protein RRG08_063323 [Elysia crispata]|uniref:Uncharacterized protein n=1 Tax=Elysia crispata TaxID=231223 RepID=A0AAE0ZVW8_9GAST|nr:hypothetical protein RRG08_063323 [Elysia crispata]